MKRFILGSLYIMSFLFVQSQPAMRIESGRSFIGETFPGQTYDIWLFSAGTSFPITQIGKPVHLNGLLALHYADASTVSAGQGDFDFAMNVSLEFLLQIQKSVGFTLAIGSGPAYQSSESIVQDKGFVFSNNLTAGLRFSFGKLPWSIAPAVRFRHMSNGHTATPNQGIDNFMVLLGIQLPLSRGD